jgi:hypothetical protein
LILYAIRFPRLKTDPSQAALLSLSPRYEVAVVNKLQPNLNDTANFSSTFLPSALIEAREIMMGFLSFLSISVLTEGPLLGVSFVIEQLQLMSDAIHRGVAQVNLFPFSFVCSVNSSVFFFHP